LPVLQFWLVIPSRLFGSESPYWLSVVVIALASESGRCLSEIVALASEIGPGFSPDINPHHRAGLQPPGPTFPIPKLFFTKTLSKSACQAPKPPNPLIPNELPSGQSPLPTYIIKEGATKIPGAPGLEGRELTSLNANICP
jgi:hypothetical protein